MKKIQTAVVVDFEGNLAQQATRNGRALEDMSSRGQRSIKKMSGGLDEARKQFGLMAAAGAKATGGAWAVNRLKPAVQMAANLQGEVIGVKTELMSTFKTAEDMDDALGRVKATAFKIQSYTPFNQAQIVALQKTLIKSGAELGFVVGESGAAAAAAALATLEGIDASETGGALIAMGTPFGVAADKFMDLANSVSAASSASQAGVQEMAEGGKYAAATMAQVGRSSDEMFAMMAQLSSVGVKGSSAGTSIAAFFNKAVKIKAFQDGNKNLLETSKIIEVIRRNTAGMGDAQQLEVLTQKFGIDGGRVALALLQEGEQSLQSYMTKIKEGTSLKDKLDERMSGFSASFEGLSGTAASTTATLFEPVLRPLTAIVDKTNEWVSALGEAAQESKTLPNTISAIATAVAALGAVYAGVQLFKAGRAGLGIVRALKGRAAAGPGAGRGAMGGGGLGGGGGAIPVYIVNGPMSVLPGRKSPVVGGAGGVGAEGVKNTAKKGGRARQIIGSPKVGGLIGAGVGVISLGSTLMSDEASTAEKVQATGEAAGGAAGAWGGAAAGAALGTLIMPVIGTAIGSLIGGALGYMGGSWLGGEAAEKVNTALDLTVKIEGSDGASGRVTAMKSSGADLNAEIYNGRGMS
ncbi:phage tail tape measure protein [Pseudomonas sp. D47]|uniref:phage tail tape measure protein n=1 Tax=Pseudomonas sp. D47 TaxID=3159447 RepID=UPI00387B33E6